MFCFITNEWIGIKEFPHIIELMEPYQGTILFNRNYMVYIIRFFFRFLLDNRTRIMRIPFDIICVTVGLF